MSDVELTGEPLARFISFIQERELAAALKNADRPHVLVLRAHPKLIPTSVVSAVTGPFPTLMDALAYAPMWEVELTREALDIDIDITPHCLIAPGD